MRYEFSVGEREVHMVGIEWSTRGLRTYTVDGDEVLRVWSRSVRGRDRFAVGDAERHEVELEYDFAPNWRGWLFATDWRIRLLVDGELVAEDLDLLPGLRKFSRLLDRMILTRLLAILALLLTLAAAWLARR